MHLQFSIRVPKVEIRRRMKAQGVLIRIKNSRVMMLMKNVPLSGKIHNTYMRSPSCAWSPCFGELGSATYLETSKFVISNNSNSGMFEGVGYISIFYRIFHVYCKSHKSIKIRRKVFRKLFEINIQHVCVRLE